MVLVLTISSLLDVDEYYEELTKPLGGFQVYSGSVNEADDGDIWVSGIERTACRGAPKTSNVIVESSYNDNDNVPCTTPGLSCHGGYRCCYTVYVPWRYYLAIVCTGAIH